MQKRQQGTRKESMDDKQLKTNQGSTQNFARNQAQSNQKANRHYYSKYASGLEWYELLNKVCERGRRNFARWFA